VNLAVPVKPGDRVLRLPCDPLCHRGIKKKYMIE
jgi:hypothetical protein